MKALIIIDFVNDFVAQNGKLTCGEPAQKIDGNIAKVAESFDKNNDLIVAACDSHIENDPYNAEAKLFPAHCIKGTPGCELYGNTFKAVKNAKALNIIKLEKQKYSAFSGTNLDQILRARGIKDIYLTGVCSDICVLHTAMDAYNLGYNINIYENGIATFNPDGHNFAINHFKNSLGAKLIKT